jgi:cardiolipin synthase
VAEFQKLFMESWQRQRGKALVARDYFPQLQSRGQQIVRVIGTTPENPQSQIFRTLMSAITHAESTIHLTVAYFAPDPQLLNALIGAAQRGVDVRLVLPSYSDSSPIFHLGRSYYSKLLKGGVKIYQRRGAIMHAKTACIDGVWSTVGSSNLDWRSFLHNDEINAVILGRGFASQMDAMFEADMKESDAIELEKWRHRSWSLRLKERMARIGAYWL